MQELAKYSFVSDFDNHSDAIDRYCLISEQVDKWLTEKGAADTSVERGNFASKTRGATGHFTQKIIENDNGQLREILLLDLIKGQHSFATNLRIGLVESKVIVYCALSVQRSSQVIAPVQVRPRCPRIIKDIISSYGDWKFEGDILPNGSVINAASYESGCELSARLTDKTRRFPVLVVSDDLEYQPWTNLAQKLASDLVGVAHVASADEDGSWALTDELGKPHSCYMGAVRLYWPLTTDDLHSSVWTAARLLAEYGEDIAGLNKFVEEIREVVFETSSLSLSNPKVLREITRQDLRQRLNDASAEEQEKELNSIIEENSNLFDLLNEANAEIAKLRSKNLSLNSQLSERPKVEVTDDSEAEEVHIPAAAGELRFYKKISKNGGADKLVVTRECSHNSWGIAPKAIQAQKGIKKLEGRDDWRTLQHCGGCINGGRWRVQW